MQSETKPLLNKVKAHFKKKIIRNGLIKKIKLWCVHIPIYKTPNRGVYLPCYPSLKDIERSVDIQKYNNFESRFALTYEKKKEILSDIFFERLKTVPNLEKPETLNEKINWLKLNYKNPLIIICCDKYRVKEYVRDKTGMDLCVRTIKTWENYNDIYFDDLPERFVLKVNWSSGYNIFVQDKSALSEHEKKLILKQLDIWTRPFSNSYYDSFNWGYKDIEPVIYAEEMLDSKFTRYEYKVFCFNGKPVFTLIEKEPNGANPQRVCIDLDGERLPFCFGEQTPADKYVVFPCYKRLIEISEKLSAEFPFVRVDFLVNESKFYLGELTFYSGGGFSHINPGQWNKELGDMLELE